jgi:hypothetical protein
MEGENQLECKGTTERTSSGKSFNTIICPADVLEMWVQPALEKRMP